MASKARRPAATDAIWRFWPPVDCNTPLTICSTKAMTSPSTAAATSTSSRVKPPEAAERMRGLKVLIAGAKTGWRR